MTGRYYITYIGCIVDNFCCSDVVKLLCFFREYCCRNGSSCIIDLYIKFDPGIRNLTRVLFVRKKMCYKQRYEY